MQPLPCYGKAKYPTSENNKISTLYPYALSKYIGEQYAYIGLRFINYQ